LKCEKFTDDGRQVMATKGPGELINAGNWFRPVNSKVLITGLWNLT
jgi:hypothetical protein